VRIASPARNAIVGSSVLVRIVAPPGIKVVPANGQRESGTGHHHILIDTPIPGTDSVIGASRLIYHLGKGTDTVTVQGLAPGSHRLVAVFAYGDHLPLKEVATDTVRVTVRP
jgi:hypothetical protein